MQYHMSSLPLDVNGKIYILKTFMEIAAQKSLVVLLSDFINMIVQSCVTNITMCSVLIHIALSKKSSYCSW